jgi:hypothetical protein
MFKYFLPIRFTFSQRVSGAVALDNKKGRQPDYRGTDWCFDADSASLRLAETRQEEGQQCQTHAPRADQHDASRAAETAGQQHHDHVTYGDGEFHGRHRFGDEDANREESSGDRE